MKKTTIILEDEVYRKLVQEALEKYGTTKKLSFLINQKIKGEEQHPRISKRITVKLGKELGPRKIEKLIEKSWKEVIAWKKQ